MQNARAYIYTQERKVVLFLCFFSIITYTSRACSLSDYLALALALALALNLGYQRLARCRWASSKYPRTTHPPPLPFDYSPRAVLHVSPPPQPPLPR